MKDANELPPLAGEAGLSVNSLPKFMVPLEAAGWKIVNCSTPTSVPYFVAWRPRIHVRFSVKTKLFCFSIEGKNPELPIEAIPSLKVRLGRPPFVGLKGTPGKPN